MLFVPCEQKRKSFENGLKNIFSTTFALQSLHILFCFLFDGSSRIIAEWLGLSELTLQFSFTFPPTVGWLVSRDTKDHFSHVLLMSNLPHSHEITGKRHRKEQIL